MPSEHARLRSATRVVLALYILLMVFWTLFPFDFAWPHGDLLRHVRKRFDGSINFIDQTDWIENIAFFVPFGFLLALAIARRGMKLPVIGGIVVAASAALSLLVETGQTLLAFRDSTLSDLIANTLGGAAGFGLFTLVAPRLSAPAAGVARLGAWAGPPVLLALASLWIALNAVALYLARDAATLADWFPGYPLVVGNETTGDRAWPGLVSEIHLADRALGADEVASLHARPATSVADLLGPSLLGSWRLFGPGPYPDASGHSPPLVWIGEPLLGESDLPAFVSRDNWLRTPSALSYATRRIAQTSSFTLVTTIENAQAHIPAIVRIVTISDGPFVRNFTLAHEGHEMVIRLRTPLMGPNGHNPELLIPGVFEMTRSQSVIITYEQPELRVYIDGVQRGRLKITPELATLFRLYPRSGWRLQIVSPVTTTHAAVYRTILLVPLLALLVPILMKRFWRRRALPVALIGLAMLLAVLVEAMIVLIGDGSTVPRALAFSLTCSGLTTAALGWFHRHTAPSYASRIAAVRIR